MQQGVSQCIFFLHNYFYLVKFSLVAKCEQKMKNYKSKSIEGLSVFLDKLICEYSEKDLSNEASYSYIYFLTVSNFSDRTITLLGRKWVLQSISNQTSIIEGDKIVSQTPTLFPGESFSYNSFHVILESTIATGVLYGVDEYDEAIHIPVPRLEMIIPDREELKKQNEIRRSQ